MKELLEAKTSAQTGIFYNAFVMHDQPNHTANGIGTGLQKRGKNNPARKNAAWCGIFRAARNTRPI